MQNRPYNLHVTEPNDNIEYLLDQLPKYKIPKVKDSKTLHPDYTPKNPSAKSLDGNKKKEHSSSTQIVAKPIENHRVSTNNDDELENSNL